MQKTKFVFITGGVLSSLGKGIAASSLGALLQARGLTVTIQKLDPYINIDPGTMSPTQHGEVFVTDDGAETDLDLGHYERFLGTALTQKNNYTSGSIYYSVIKKERRGDYHGGTVQVIPHITDEIKKVILSLCNVDTPADVALIEIGGTVGDIESLPFLEAIRQLRGDLGRERCLFLHLTLVPYLRVAGEHKTKPTQHSVKELRSIGIQPDMILCRCEVPISHELKRKIALFCDVDIDAVFSSPDLNSVYEAPLRLYDEGLDRKVITALGLSTQNANLTGWRNLEQAANNLSNLVRIAVVGKYVELKEAYKSLNEAVYHSGVAHSSEVHVEYINSEDVCEESYQNLLAHADGIVVPGGFGARGVEGKILAARFARENNVPFLGVGLGMQCAVLDFARNVANLTKANSEEFAPQAGDKIFLLGSVTDLKNYERSEMRETYQDKEGMMRLGSYPCNIKQDTLAHDAYGELNINERHRNRYEFNLDYKDTLAKSGLVFSGMSPDGQYVEIIELADHPWFLGCLFMPEYKSTPMKPHPLINGFIKAALKNSKG